MRENLTHRTYGTPILEWIETMADAIEDDHVSLWGILAGAEGYYLDREETIEFARRCIGSLLDAGAVPVVITGMDSPMFAPTDRFGTQRDEIIEAVIADWLANGGGELDWGVYPFTFPKNFDLIETYRLKASQDAGERQDAGGLRPPARRSA